MLCKIPPTFLLYQIETLHPMLIHVLLFLLAATTHSQNTTRRPFRHTLGPYGAPRSATTVTSDFTCPASKSINRLAVRYNQASLKLIGITVRCSDYQSSPRFGFTDHSNVVFLDLPDDSSVFDVLWIRAQHNTHISSIGVGHEIAVGALVGDTVVDYNNTQVTDPLKQAACVLNGVSVVLGTDQVESIQLFLNCRTAVVYPPDPPGLERILVTKPSIPSPLRRTVSEVEDDIEPMESTPPTPATSPNPDWDNAKLISIMVLMMVVMILILAILIVIYLYRQYWFSQKQKPAVTGALDPEYYSATRSIVDEYAPSLTSLRGTRHLEALPQSDRFSQYSSHQPPFPPIATAYDRVSDHSNRTVSGDPNVPPHVLVVPSDHSLCPDRSSFGDVENGPLITPIKVIGPRAVKLGFVAKDHEEVTVSVGDLVSVHAVYSDGWAYVTVLSTERRGLVPITVIHAQGADVDVLALQQKVDKLECNP